MQHDTITISKTYSILMNLDNFITTGLPVKNPSISVF